MKLMPIMHRIHHCASWRSNTLVEQTTNQNSTQLNRSRIYSIKSMLQSITTYAENVKTHTIMWLIP
jgi:hypothetical protein